MKQNKQARIPVPEYDTTHKRERERRGEGGGLALKTPPFDVPLKFAQRPRVYRRSSSIIIGPPVAQISYY